VPLSMQLTMLAVQRRRRGLDYRENSIEVEEEEGEEVEEEASWENVKETLQLPVDLSQQAQSKPMSLGEDPALELSCQ